MEKVKGVISHRGSSSASGRSQIIAAVDTNSPTAIKRLAVMLAEHYGYDLALVNFYSDETVVSRFDGSGTMLDEKSWIGHVSVSVTDGDVSFTPSPFTD